MEVGDPSAVNKEPRQARRHAHLGPEVGDVVDRLVLVVILR